jgi:large conductance mechanosensitive channel
MVLRSGAHADVNTIRPTDRGGIVLKEFKDFVTRGNIVEIAVGLIIALAFKTVVDSLVADVITPLVGAIFGQPDFSSLTISLWSDATITYGSFLNTVFSFLAVAAAVFFFVVKPYNSLKERRVAEEEAAADEPEGPSEDVVLLREIRDALRAR